MITAVPHAAAGRSRSRRRTQPPPQSAADRARVTAPGGTAPRRGWPPPVAAHARRRCVRPCRPAPMPPPVPPPVPSGPPPVPARTTVRQPQVARPPRGGPLLPPIAGPRVRWTLSLDWGGSPTRARRRGTRPRSVAREARSRSRPTHPIATAEPRPTLDRDDGIPSLAPARGPRRAGPGPPTSAASDGRAAWDRRWDLEAARGGPAPSTTRPRGFDAPQSYPVLPARRAPRARGPSCSRWTPRKPRPSPPWAGFCEELIPPQLARAHRDEEACSPRRANKQDMVRIVVCQGESRSPLDKQHGDRRTWSCRNLPPRPPRRGRRSR